LDSQLPKLEESGAEDKCPAGMVGIP